ncbi:DUF1152 domain-containing protein [Paenibacillus faecalis]|uniref:DUF1152 domain-containing protein n=1 Tax=Paenibacillus faecalis TaxID=2079532 RepID=UPI000D1118EA|nr:DUF1152 domain-containing protein [Paenibacillus faecalis]
MNNMQKKILLLAAGGGFDIVTVQMLREYMLTDSNSLTIETAGWLNPKFDHYYIKDGYVEFEKPVNILDKNNQVIRFRRSEVKYDSTDHPGYRWYERQGETKELVDDELSNMMQSHLINLSTRYGINPLISFFKQYDEVIICDVGGDILYSGPKDNEVKTPLIDAFSLAALRHNSLSNELNVRVMVFGLGTDGEINAEHLEENINHLIQMGGLISKNKLTHKHIELLSKYFIPIRKKYGGNTIRCLLEIWNYSNNKHEFHSSENARKRNLVSYYKWFNYYFVFNYETILQLNPLSRASSMKEIYKEAIGIGWIQK